MTRDAGRRLVAGLLAMSVSAAGWTTPGLAQESGRGERLKAAIIYKMLRFVAWPPTAVTGQLRLCVIGDSGVGEALAPVDGKRVGERSLSLDVDLPASESHRCHALFIGKDYTDDIDGLAARSARHAILTLSDQTDFAREAGMIGLTIRDGRIAFEINPENARRAGLAISAQLLQLADIIGN